MSESLIQINQYEFNSSLFESLNSNRYAKELWPVVYIITDNEIKEAYVGETTDTFSRLNSHLRNKRKNKLTAVQVITSEKFNKSATLDIESNLIKYMSADNNFQLQNGNLGLANHNYYQKNSVYWSIFNEIWDKLRAINVAKHSIESINNSDLFKYSPFKSLSIDQRNGLFQILQTLNKNEKTITLVEGGAGSGKTILAIFLFKLLLTDLSDFNFQEFDDMEGEFVHLLSEIKEKYPNPKMALVIPMSSFRKTISNVFKNIKGLNSNMVIGPAEISNSEYDIVLVDEAHRLRRRVNLGAYFGAFDKANERLNFKKEENNELDWILKQSKSSILFYDENQSIKPSDVQKDDFIKLKKYKDTNLVYLKSQFRSKGGNAYEKFTNDLLENNFSSENETYESEDYELRLFYSLSEMILELKKRENEYGLSRLIAGFSWPWISNKDKNLFDIEIEDVKLKWNSTSLDWINSSSSKDEVGCIHTTQGYDLNYSGIIFGNEISYDPEKKEIFIKPENYYDKNGKQSIKDPKELKRFILNIYKTIMLRGIRGTYIYVCDPELRNYFSKHILPHISRVNALVETNTDEEIIPFQNSIPFYNLKIAAGEFSEKQQNQEHEWIKISDKIKISSDLFACQIDGESMNRIIPNGSVCLFKKDQGGSRNGKIVLVESTNLQESEFGSNYTIKEYHSKKFQDEHGWEHQTITLKPLSDDPNFKNLELKDDETNDFKVIGIFERVLFTNQS